MLLPAYWAFDLFQFNMQRFSLPKKWFLISSNELILRYGNFYFVVIVLIVLLSEAEIYEKKTYGIKIPDGHYKNTKVDDN